MDRQSCGLDAENVRSLLGDGPPERRNGATGPHTPGARTPGPHAPSPHAPSPHAPGTRSNGPSRNGTEPAGTRPSSTAPQPIILPRRVPALDWPATLYDDTSHDLDAADGSGEAMLRIVRQVRFPSAHDQRVVRLMLGQRSDWGL